MAILDSLRQLFRYETAADTPIGRGGCGRIWKAHDRLFDRTVAIKTIDEVLLTDFPDAARRSFVKEAIAGARLGDSCRHIVRVLDLGASNNVPYFVMEWLEAAPDQSASDCSDMAGKLSLASAKTVLFQIADATLHAHQAGIVHSDIAPWNILYDSRARVYKLSDFGLLRIVEEHLTSRGSGSLLIGGRPDFQPPEVRHDIRQVTYASDVYALAVTFRVLLEGDSCLANHGGCVVPTPSVLRVRHEQRDAPQTVRQLLTRFIDDHTAKDTVTDFIAMLQRIAA